MGVSIFHMNKTIRNLTQHINTYQHIKLFMYYNQNFGLATEKINPKHVFIIFFQDGLRIKTTTLPTKIILLVMVLGAKSCRANLTFHFSIFQAGNYFKKAIIVYLKYSLKTYLNFYGPKKKFQQHPLNTLIVVHCPISAKLYFLHEFLYLNNFI